MQRLKNRGPVSLSAQNPYLAGNLLLTREMESSQELKGFIDYRGAPLALEVTQELFDPLTLALYYPENQEMYVLEELSQTWIIRGPLAIPPDKLPIVNELKNNEKPILLPSAPSGSADPSTSAFKEKQAASPSAEPSTVERDLFISKLEEELPAPKIAGAFRSSLSTQPEAPLEKLPRSKPTPGYRVSEEQQFLKDLALTLGEPAAEISPKGDLVHYVTLPGETLSILARWYTWDRENAERLARINQLRDSNKLSLGDVVIVPSYLVKNKSRLTDRALKAIQDRLSAELY